MNVKCASFLLSPALSTFLTALSLHAADGPTLVPEKAKREAPGGGSASNAALHFSDGGIEIDAGSVGRSVPVSHGLATELDDTL